MDHDAITNIVTRNRTVEYGVGITPNPFVSQVSEWQRRHVHAAALKTITDKIESLMEPRFITPPETSECIEAIITMTDARRILEIGTCTGFGTLHMLRAIYGKSRGQIVSIDARPAHDRAFWARPEFVGWLEFVEGWTPDVFGRIRGPFDLVFVDSDHSIEHTTKELNALWPLTRKKTLILFHDLPEWKSPAHPVVPEVRQWLYDKVDAGELRGIVLPTARQLDCIAMWGEDYPPECSPHLGIFMRR